MLRHFHTTNAQSFSDQKYVDNYKKDCAARDRASLLFRRQEANMQRLEEAVHQQEMAEMQASSNSLDVAAWQDVQDYVKDCKQRRRLSLAFRAKEKRKQVEWERAEAERKKAEERRDIRIRATDRRYQELATRKEREKLALDALRNAGCTFAANPFAGLIN